MSSNPNLAAGPRVGAYALIGHDDKLLLITSDPGPDVLPGGHVPSGEPVEQALRRMLVEQLGVAVAALDFCAAVEHNVTTHEDGPVFEVSFLFDVTLTDPLRVPEHLRTTHRWATESDLDSLRPEVVRDGLIENSFSIENPWWAWTP
jgi:ADP-ribose pyrophosphatase YjhB (NUDIX family)